MADTISLALTLNNTWHQIPSEVYRNSRSSSSFGHHVKKVTHSVGGGLKTVAKKIKIISIDTIRVAGDVVKERPRLGKVVKLTLSILTGVGYAVGNAFRGAGLIRALSITDGLLDVGDLAADADHLINKRYQEYEKDPRTGEKIKKPVDKWALAATINLLVADVGGVLLWLDELVLINLSKISATIGQGFSKLAAALGPRFTGFTASLAKSCPFLAKTIAKISLLNVLRTIVGAAFVCLIVHESVKMGQAIKAKEYHEMAISLLNIASYTAEVALKVLAIAGCTTVPGLVALGCVAAGMGLAAIVYKLVKDYREERQAALMASLARANVAAPAA